MEQKARTLFGDIVSVPDDLGVAFSIDLTSTGTVHENYGVETLYLRISFLMNGPIKIERVFIIARGTDGYGYAKKFRPQLFKDLHAGRLSEDKKREFSLFLLEKYREGNVREEDMVRKLEALVKTNAKSVCAYCTRQ